MQECSPLTSSTATLSSFPNPPYNSIICQLIRHLKLIIALATSFIMTNEQKAFLYTGQSHYNIPRNVTHVKVDSSVKMIGEWAFLICSQLSIVELREGLEVIGKVAFHCCTSLERITIPSSVRVVGGRAFEGCTQLKIVKLCEGLERILLELKVYEHLVRCVLADGEYER